MPDESKRSESSIEEIVSNPELTKIYANGFSTAIGNGDCTVVLMQNGHPVGLLNLSYTVAKTLSISLGDAISKVEELTGNSIMTTWDIEESISGKRGATEPNKSED
jgi:hypothetical protein